MPRKRRCLPNSRDGSDSFIGAYAVDYVRQKHRGEKFDIVQAITFASKAAARTIEAIGAQESLPWADEMDRKY